MKQLTTGIGNWQTYYWDKGSPEAGKIIACSREKRQGSDRHLGLGWRHHCSIKNHDNGLRCQKSTRGNISHGRQREITLVSEPKNQTRRRQSQSCQKCYIATMLERFHMDQCKPSRTPVHLNLKLQTTQNGDNNAWLDQMLGWITSISGQTDEARNHDHSHHSVQTHERTCQSTLAIITTIINQNDFCCIFNVQKI